MKSAASIVSAFGGGIVLIVACGGSTESSSSKSSSSSSSSSASSSGFDAGPPSTMTGSSTSTSSSSGYDYYPPGCMDAGRQVYFLRVDDSHIRISNADGGAAGICAGNATRPNDCYFDYFDYLLTVPSGAKTGSWNLSDPAVTLTRMKYFPRSISPSGCVCQPADTTPLKITQGTVKLEETDAGPDYVGAITISGIQTIHGGGEISALMFACP